MLLYLANVRTSTIMLTGRWKSDAFLLYLRKNIKEFTEGVTSSMISQPDVFFSISSTSNSGGSNDLPRRQLADRDDPRVPHADSISSTLRFNGPGNSENTSSAAAHFIAPALRIWG